MARYMIEIRRDYAFVLDAPSPELAVQLARSAIDHGGFYETKDVKELSAEAVELPNTTGGKAIRALNESHLQSRDDRFTKYEGPQ
jgi:hypothetical protein